MNNPNSSGSENTPIGKYKKKRKFTQIMQKGKLINPQKRAMSKLELGLTWTSADGVGELKLSEREAIAHITARIVTATVSRAFAL